MTSSAFWGDPVKNASRLDWPFVTLTFFDFVFVVEGEEIRVRFGMMLTRETNYKLSQPLVEHAL